MPISIARIRLRFSVTVTSTLIAFAANAQLPAQQQVEQAPGRVDKNIDLRFLSDPGRPAGSVLNRVDLPNLPSAAPPNSDEKAASTACTEANRDTPACKQLKNAP